MSALLLYLALWSPPAWMVHAANVAATVADVESTQACLRAGTCKEGNPLMPSNRAGAYGITLSLDALEGWYAHRERAQGKRRWWLVPVISGGVHAGAAAGNGVRFGW